MKKIFIAVISLFLLCCCAEASTLEPIATSLTSLSSTTALQTTAPQIIKKYDRTIMANYKEVKNKFSENRNAYDVYPSIPKNYYENVQININHDYPELTGMLDRQKQEKVNEIIKTHVLDWFNDDLVFFEKSNMNYEITLNTPDLLSIKFGGEEYQIRGMHPYNISDSITIDLNTLSVLELRDIVLLNEEFVEKLHVSNNIVAPLLEANYSQENQEYLLNIVRNYTLNELVEDFRKENKYSRDFYLTPTSIWLNLSTKMSALGDYFWLEVKDE
jgi:hypothetical protein